MEIKYQIRYQEEVLHNQIPNLSLSAQKLIKRAIEERLMVDPIGFGKPLRYSLKGHRRLRVSDYRVVYRIEEKVSCCHKAPQGRDKFYSFGFCRRYERKLKGKVAT